MRQENLVEESFVVFIPHRKSPRFAAVKRTGRKGFPAYCSRPARMPTGHRHLGFPKPDIAVGQNVTITLPVMNG
jgi:hypothetical protein